LFDDEFISSQGIEEEEVDDDGGCCVNLCKTAEDGVSGIRFLDLVNVDDKGVDGVVDSKFLLQLFTLSLFCELVVCKVLVGVLDGVLLFEEEEEMVTFLIPLLLTKGVSSSSSSSFFFNGGGELFFQNNNN